MRAKPRRSGGAGGRASSSSTTTSCARRALLFTAALTVANASQNHQHPRPPHEAASSSISSKQKVLLPITPDNFLGAIAECLEEDANGLCPKYGEESKYGEMKDWNVSEVTDMDYGFHKQESFNGDVSRWDTSSVTSMREMFSGARDFSPDKKKGLGSWDTSNVEDMGSMFSEASNFNGKGLAKWNVGKVKDMSFMLKDAVSFAEDLGAWRPFKCKTTYGMFQNAVEFESDVKDWGLSVTADTKDMFLGAANFLGRFTCEHPLNGPPSTCEDEKKKTALGEKTTVTKMTTLRGSGGKSKKKSFKHVAAMGSDEDDEDADKIEEEVTAVVKSDSLTAKRHHLHVMDQIGDEDVDEELERLKKKLDRLQSETPEEMQAEHNSHGHKQLDDNSFYRAVSKCIIESAAGLCVEYGAVTRFGMMPDWDVSKVSTMTHAFQHYEEFNADLSSWNTKSVTDMSFMFYDAKSFNSNISGWNVAGVTNMKQMFRGAKSLNQDVVSWFANRPSSQMKVLNIDGIFDGAEKIEAAYECGLSKFLDNAMDMCRFSNAARGAKASAKAAAKARAKAGAKSSAKTAAKSGAKATARASETARDASEAELGSSQSFPRLGWNLPREEASSSTDGAGFATLYVCVGMAMVAVAIRAKRDSIVRTMESHFYSSPLDVKCVEEKEGKEEEENQNIIISNNNTTYGTLSEEEETLL